MRRIPKQPGQHVFADWLEQGVALALAVDLEVHLDVMMLFVRTEEAGRGSETDHTHRDKEHRVRIDTKSVDTCNADGDFIYI